MLEIVQGSRARSKRVGLVVTPWKIPVGKNWSHSRTSAVSKKRRPFPRKIGEKAVAVESDNTQMIVNDFMIRINVMKVKVVCFVWLDFYRLHWPTSRQSSNSCFLAETFWWIVAVRVEQSLYFAVYHIHVNRSWVMLFHVGVLPSVFIHSWKDNVAPKQIDKEEKWALRQQWRALTRRGVSIMVSAIWHRPHSNLFIFPIRFFGGKWQWHHNLAVIHCCFITIPQ